MFYQYNLLKKKGQFGVVWLAAHYPSKLTKHDILTFDLETKCKEILEFITNGQYNKPRLSIKLSSYLMYGLVVIYQRKTNYYYNDLAQINSLLKPNLVISALKAQQKTPRKTRAGKRVTINKSALEIKENMPEDITMDLTFRMPEEQIYDLTIPSYRIRDITLPETEIEQYGLMYPIPMEGVEFELPPAPSQFLFEDPDELARHLMHATSTVKKPTERRTPLMELDINRIPMRVIPEAPEDTYIAIEQAMGADIGLGQTIVEPSQLFAATRVRRDLFEETADLQHAIEPPVEATPFAGEKKVPEPIVHLGDITQRTLEILKPKEKQILKRKNVLIDKTIIIDDKEFSKQTKHKSQLPKLPIKMSAKSELLSLNLFQMTNNEVFQPTILALPKNLRSLNVMNRVFSYTRHTRLGTKSPFYESLASSVLESDLLVQTVTKEDISRRRAARSTSLLPPPEALSILRPEDTESKLEELGSLHRAEEIRESIQPEFQQLISEYEPVPFYEASLGQTTEHVQDERVLTLNEQHFLNQVKDGKVFFHDIAPVATTKKKTAASTFYTLLRLSANRKVKPTQDEPYKEIYVQLF